MANMKLGSEFLKPFNEYEKTYFGSFTKNMLIMFIGLAICMILVVVMKIFKLSDIFIYLVVIIIGSPSVLVGLNRMESIKERFNYQITIQDRSYMTEFDNKGSESKNGFVQQKGIKETDKI